MPAKFSSLKNLVTYRSVMAFFGLVAFITLSILFLVSLWLKPLALEGDGTIQTKKLERKNYQPLPAKSPISASPTLSPTASLVPTLTPTLSPTSIPVSTSSSVTGQMETVYLTLYGYPDNDPPGRAIAYPRVRHSESVHDEAGGTGTYSDPITLAVMTGEYAIGTIFYLPFIQKYAVVEDLCASCGSKHIDLWLESDENHTEAVYECQRRYTRARIEVEVNPPSNRVVDLEPLFDIASGNCKA